MSLTLADLRTEFFARGFDYLPTTRAHYYLNRAYQDTCGAEDWPFLEATSSGPAPLTISDLRTIEAVVDTTQGSKLRPLDRRNITDDITDLSTAGSPQFYYTTTATTVNTFPVSATDTIQVRYWKVPATLTADTDTTVLPDRFILTVIDRAAMYAYYDSDNFDGAQAMRALWAESLDEMRDQLLSQQHDEPDDYIAVYDVPTGYWDD